jgi:hypothetical protein
MKDTTQCPMCTRRFADRTDLRVHLMCDHRKSSITEELLATVETRDDRSMRERQPIPVGDS